MKGLEIIENVFSKGDPNISNISSGGGEYFEIFRLGRTILGGPWSHISYLIGIIGEYIFQGSKT